MLAALIIIATVQLGCEQAFKENVDNCNFFGLEKHKTVRTFAHYSIATSSKEMVISLYICYERCNQ